jgi:hypothetical protein
MAKKNQPKKKNTATESDCEKKLSILIKAADLLEEDLRLHQWIMALNKQHLKGCLDYTGEITNEDLAYAEQLTRRMLKHAENEKNHGPVSA